MGKTVNQELRKLNKLPHPKSRKTAQLAKKLKKQEKRQKVKHVNLMRTNILGEKLLWFKNEMPDVLTCTPQILLNLIERYLSRFNEELQQIRLKHEVGQKRNRQHANRQDVIKITISDERKEFETAGIELPDLLNPRQFELFKNWNGELRFLNNFKLNRFSKKKLEDLIVRKSGKSLSNLNLNIFENMEMN